MNRDYWNSRYVDKGASGAGTFTHTVEANRWFYRIKYDRINSLLKECGIDLAGKHVLDVACGSGSFIPFFLSKKPSSVTGIDFSSAAIEMCRRSFSHEPTLAFQTYDICNRIELPLNKTFDLVCIFEAIFCINDPKKWELALENLCNFVAPNSYLLISDHFPKLTKKPHENITYFSVDKYFDILRRNGFVVLKRTRQTNVFNRQIFPARLQILMESRFPYVLYIIDKIGLRLSLDRDLPTDIYYLLAKKQSQ